MSPLSNLSHISPFKFMAYDIYNIYLCNKPNPFRVAWMIYLFMAD